MKGSKAVSGALCRLAKKSVRLTGKHCLNKKTALNPKRLPLGWGDWSNGSGS